MFIVAMFICEEFLSSPSKQAVEGKSMSYDLESSVILLGYLYSIENGLGNKAEVTFIAHCVLTA